MVWRRSIGPTHARDARHLAVAALVATLALAAADGALAAPKTKAAGTGAADDQRVVADLAHSITARLPPPPAPGAACDADARAAVKSAVQAAIDAAKTTPAIAVKAIDLARGQPPSLDACRDGAMADAATESAGAGEVVDEADVQRGFVLYTGPWPPPPRSAATQVSMASDASDAAPATSPKPRPTVKTSTRRRYSRHKAQQAATAAAPAKS
jgi:hypothetical protein